MVREKKIPRGSLKERTELCDRAFNNNIPKKVLEQIYNNNSVELMKEVLKKYGKSEKEYKPGVVVRAWNKMDRGEYCYELTAKYGDVYSEDFQPYFTPAEILFYGSFEGKICNDFILELPREWFLPALEAGKLSPEGPNPDLNYFGIKSRLSLREWERRGWIYKNDLQGFFIWFMRYYAGRRDPEVDAIQIARWKSFKRHLAQVEKNCDSIDCRPKQRQALLQWSYDCFISS